MTSAREIGDNFEKEVLETLNSVGHLDLGAFEMTAGSGSKFMDGDIRHRHLVVECKVKGNCKGFTAPSNELNKLITEADRQGKDWLYVEQNANGRQMVLLDLETFQRISETWRLENL